MSKKKAYERLRVDPFTQRSRIWDVLLVLVIVFAMILLFVAQGNHA